jgi:hypothetical protein
MTFREGTPKAQHKWGKRKGKMILCMAVCDRTDAIYRLG